MMGVVDKVSVFFPAHPKCQRALDKSIEENQPESTVSKLKDLCHTRWVQRIDALHVSSLSTTPLWLAWKEFVVMAQAFSPQMLSLMLGVYN